MKKYFGKVQLAVGSVAGAASALVIPAISHANLTMPTMPTTDLETAGTAVLAIVALGAVIGLVVKVFHKAG